MDSKSPVLLEIDPSTRARLWLGLDWTCTDLARFDNASWFITTTQQFSLRGSRLIANPHESIFHACRGLWGTVGASITPHNMYDSSALAILPACCYWSLACRTTMRNECHQPRKLAMLANDFHFLSLKDHKLMDFWWIWSPRVDGDQILHLQTVLLLQSMTWL